jgi:hypothetical protein
MLIKALEEEYRDLFEECVREWLADTQWQSSISSITRHPQFAAICDIGPPAVKFILRRMEKGDVHVHWFPVLKDISGQDPVPPEIRGNIPQMARAWTDWGKARGYLP